MEEGCMWREVTPVLLLLHSLPTHAILYTWATLSTSPTDIILSTGVVTLVTGVIFTWATLSMTPTDISLSTGAIGGWWMWRKGGCGGRIVDVAIHTSHGSLVTHAKNNVQPLTTKRIDSGHLC